MKLKHYLQALGTGAYILATAAGAETMSDGRDSISEVQVRAALLSAPPGAIEKASREQLVRFIENLLIDKRLEAAALNDKLDQNPIIAARIEKTRRDVLVKSYVEQTAARIAAELPDLEPLARERYEVEKPNLKRKEAVRVAHILFRASLEDEKAAAEARTKAEGVLLKLKEGADFASLAKEHSQDGSAAQGGELDGWRDKGTLVPAFEKAAYALKPGAISELVWSNFGYHIIKLLEYRPETQLSYDESREQLMAKIRNEQMEKRRQEWIKDFRGTKPVEIDDAMLEALRRR